MDAGPSGDGRRRGKKNRGRSNRRKRSKGGGGGGGGGGRGGNRGYQQSYQDKLPTEPHLDDRSVLSGRPLRTVERTVEDGPLDEFMLFCAYCLGITPTDGYHKPHLDDIARRFNVGQKEIKGMVAEFGLDDETFKRCKFDLVGAQIDIRVAPEGMSRTEIARDLFQELNEAKEE